MHFLAQLLALNFGKAFKCMRLGAWVGVGLWLALFAGAANADHASAVVIAGAEQGQIEAKAYYWHEIPGKAAIEQAASSGYAASYMPLTDETMFDFKPQDRVWIRLDVERKSASLEHVMLWLPLPLLDSVTFYQQSAEGKWKALQAGDRVAVAEWPEPGRYPRFHVEPKAGKSTYYLQIQGSTPLSIPLHMGSEASAQAEDRHGFLAMGGVVGVMFTLVLMCMVTAYTYRDKLYFLYGLYMLVMIFAVTAYTGIAAYLFWDRSPMWADTAQGVLAILAAGGALYFVEAMLGGRRFARRISTVLLALGGCSLPLALLYFFAPRSVGVIILGVYMLSVGLVGLTLAVRAWRNGDEVGKWIFAAYAPLVIAVLMAIARAYGWLIVSWVVQYGVVAALLIEAPMMMAALHVRSRQRHEISTREQAMATQDALTGLLVEHIFDDRVRQTLARAKKRKEDSAIVLISLVNYDAIAAAYGLPVAEQSVLRAVIKLRKVLRDVDTVARVGTSQFGLILEGVSHRSRVTDIGARLVAQGLMPLPGLVPEVTLQFHISAALMRELPSADADLKAELLTLLASMSRRTRRPIRFLEALTTGGSPLTAIASKPTAVDVLASKVATAVASVPAEAGSTLAMVDSSGSNWSSSGHSQTSTRGGDTVVDIEKTR